MTKARNIAEFADDLSVSNGEVSIADLKPSQSMMFRNKIINGGMHIAQRGTNFGTVNLVGSTFPYNLDRFCTGRANVVHNGHCTISQITGGGQKHQITQASGSALDGSEYFTIRQHIEGFNCFDLAGKQATLSFKVKTNKAGNYGVSFYDGTGSATITPQSITVSTADASAENKVSYTKTFTMPSSITADNASRLRLDICLAAHNRAGEYYPTGGTQVDLFDSTANYFELYDVQLEEGTVATPFEHRPIGTELALCQRYFQSIAMYGLFVFPYHTTLAFVPLPLFVPLRSKSAVTLSKTAKIIRITTIAVVDYWIDGGNNFTSGGDWAYNMYIENRANRDGTLSNLGLRINKSGSTNFPDQEPVQITGVGPNSSNNGFDDVGGYFEIESEL